MARIFRINISPSGRGGGVSLSEIGRLSRLGDKKNSGRSNANRAIVVIRVIGRVYPSFVSDRVLFSIIRRFVSGTTGARPTGGWRQRVISLVGIRGIWAKSVARPREKSEMAGSNRATFTHRLTTFDVNGALITKHAPARTCPLFISISRRVARAHSYIYKRSSTRVSSMDTLSLDMWDWSFIKMQIKYRNHIGSIENEWRIILVQF